MDDCEQAMFILSIGMSQMAAHKLVNHSYFYRSYRYRTRLKPAAKTELQFNILPAWQCSGSRAGLATNKDRVPRSIPSDAAMLL